MSLREIIVLLYSLQKYKFIPKFGPIKNFANVDHFSPNGVNFNSTVAASS